MLITAARPAPQRRFHAARPAEHDRSTQPLCRCNVDAPTMNSQNIGPAVDSSIAPAHRPSPSVVIRAAKKKRKGSHGRSKLLMTNRLRQHHNEGAVRIQANAAARTVVRAERVPALLARLAFPIPRRFHRECAKR